ncbi:DNA-directed RNA polymerase sigma-70 factor [Planobispora longispora]|uniref:DNA-directed RNA polymerase sigma-70 factor n=1 Tax=Planobispora longispora TaxID=28887 RepID=A0A8J3W1X7_9ACTN|nr:DNA-directed RNA polymerase sigma-70 factor [Planobispora longispora]
MTGGIPPDPAATGGEQCDHFIAMYSRYYDEVLRYAWRRVGPDYAAEVVSETFTVAWRRAGELPEHELPWLYTVARNIIANRRRAEERQEHLLTALAETVRTEPDHADAVTRRQAAVEALQSLSPDDRELVRLVAWDGLDARGAAAVLGCSAAAVHVRLHRLRKRLSRTLGSSIRTEARP